MTPEELEKLKTQVRDNIVTAGFNPTRIEDRPLTATAMWIRDSRVAMGPYPMALCYQAIAWTLNQKLKEAANEQPAGD